MKVLLVQPPHYYDGGSRPPTFFPIGLGYVARVLLDAGHKVTVLDIWAHQWTKEQVQQQIQKLNDCDIIGISGLSTQYAYIKWLIAELKKYTSVRIAVGGALATFSPEVVLTHTKADICVISEGEITFKEVVENPDNLEGISGIYFKQDNKIIKNPPRPYIKNLATIPFPAWDLFPMEIYRNNCVMFGYPHVKAINVITSRGCPWNCHFCSRTFSGARLRPIDNVIAEIAELKKRYGIGGIIFNDELVIVNKQRANELCEKIQPLRILWDCQGRVNTVDLDLLKRINKAGCLSIGYGIETGSQAILDVMNKRTTVERAHTALKDTKTAKLIPVLQMMFGYPGETSETLQETVAFFQNSVYLGPKVLNRIYLNPTVALPGSELYRQALATGMITDENAYLERLSSGYMPDMGNLLINFTSFSEQEYWQKKIETERQIVSVQVRKYPVRFLLDSFLLKLAQVYSHYKRFGLKKTAAAILAKLPGKSRIVNNEKH